MLLEKNINTLASAGVQEVKRATIKTSPKIFNFFADQTYANKPKAICRELVANAFDSHVMAGKPDLPVEVWLPTILEPTFKVVDHGLGMSHSFMMNEFMCYADGSTKDQSNIAIGGFGIGSKSPFAYVDQYTVRSIHDGIESVYSIFKDEEGIPAIGLLGQRATQEPNGVTVEFPVKPEDFETFEEAAFEALRYFEPLPEIRNATEGSFNPPQYVARGKSWGMRPSEGDLQIIMGGVMYPVNVQNLSYKFSSSDAAYKLLRYGLDLRVPIGTCSVALSREALSYDDRTIEAIRTACEGVIDEVAETFANRFDDIDSPWEVRVALGKEIGSSYRSERGKFLEQHAKWRGDAIGLVMDYPKLITRKTTETLDYTLSGYSIWDIPAEKDRRGRRGKIKPIGSAKWESPDKYGFRPSDYAYLIIDDLPQLPKHKAIRKIKEFADENGERCLIIRPWEDAVLDPQDIVKAFGSPNPDRVILTSSLPEPIVERGYTKNANRPKVRMFMWDGTDHSSWRNDYQQNLNPGPYGKRGVVEIPYADQPQTGILVVMEQFIVPRDVRQKVNSGLLDYSELRFVNAGDAKKLKGWVSYADEFERRKKAKIAAYPQLAQRLAVSKAPELKNIFDFFSRNSAVDFTSRKPLGQIFKLYKEYVEPLDSEQHKLAQFVTDKLPRGVKPEELRDKFKTKQPKAWRLLQILPAHLDEEDLKLFQENL